MTLRYLVRDLHELKAAVLSHFANNSSKILKGTLICFQMIHYLPAFVVVFVYFIDSIDTNLDIFD